MAVTRKAGLPPLQMPSDIERRRKAALAPNSTTAKASDAPGPDHVRVRRSDGPGPHHVPMGRPRSEWAR